ncbi:Urea carboxylase and allophanate hydrolase activities involved in uracile catabolism, putative [Yarrowia lipolytica]|nr:Urea carboxylase and allophanate hydrolase activities involved in uracile catabolism, putative [Yarrowia lipolytica]
MSTSIGWTIPEWKEAQTNSSYEEGRHRLLDLVATFKDYKRGDPAWITLASTELINKQWKELQLMKKDPESLPLYGVPFAVKDSIDVADFPTTVACPAYLYVAKEDATTVRLIKEAGGIVVGKTNLDQFATGLVGTRSPYGKTPNTFSDKHVSGGSSSGSASVVARGLVPFSLGSDTAGSGRVPASLNNLIGLKPSAGIVSMKGAVPACKTIDCLSIFSLVLSDAQLVFNITAHYDKDDFYSRSLPHRPLKSFGPAPVFAVPENPLWFGDELNPEMFDNAVEHLRQQGVKVVKIDFNPLFDLAKCLYEGPWVAERYATLKDFMQNRKEDMNETVYGIIKHAETFTAADAFSYEYKRRAIVRKIEEIFSSIDGLFVPTCPLFPTMDSVAKEPVTVNANQGTYTNFVNLADLSALAIPAGFRKDGLPFGITLISQKFNDHALLDMAQKFLSTSRPLGALPKDQFTAKKGDALASSIVDNMPRTIPLAVVGAHMTGMPLNWQLQKVEATLARRTQTAKNYRLYALANTVPSKPGLRRVLPSDTTLRGEAIEVEVWDVPYQTFGEFVSMIPHPLGIGTIELADGKWVKGFICEQQGYDDAEDITKFGGWRAFKAEIKLKSESKPFETVLVANRGEIAVRLIKTLRKMGIRAIAVFSEPDRFAQHVLDADDSVSLEGTTAAETYLSIPKIIAACKQTGAEAILPGYGFLSENADFSDACEEAGIVFVGPTGDSIRKLGLKHSAREIALASDVPLVPGTGLIETVAEAEEAAKKLEYPLMIKSTAGGGGIGLQKVDKPEDLKRAFDTVKHQGKSFFGDDGVFMERFVEKARHVEVQILGDGKGNAIAIGERDCSLQRRNQKVIEETPAPNFPAETRTRMMNASEMLAKNLNYRGAGTVEFIFDEKRNEFYFLEVNARLQVEHPITEYVTGLDLVEWMILIGAGKAPDFEAQCAKTPKGASIEARLYAENPIKDFVPSPGQLTDVQFPTDARVDTWVSRGTKVSAEYDPTLAKIIVYGTDRADALQKLQKALEETVVAGVTTNLDYLKSIVGSEMFAEAKVSTQVLDSYNYHPNAIEITAPGSYTTVQDYPGRTKLWHIGVPPSGPMDTYAFRVANQIVGNNPKAPAIEATLVGPSILFHSDTVIAVTGGSAEATLNGNPIEFWKPVNVKAGQTLATGRLTSGCRLYIAIRKGLSIPEYLGSRSTFAFGNLGGFNGRTLKFGDVIFMNDPELPSCSIPAPISEPAPASADMIPQYGNSWTVGVTCGPHGSPDFFAQGWMDTFFDSKWKIHYNSNRFGVRLIGPKPEWARKDGGEAGLHPSNQHDYVYSLGAVNFTGDEPVILTCDGPSLGGFVCAAVVAEAELWKIGQVKPGDTVQFVPMSIDSARQLKKAQDRTITNLCGSSYESVDALLALEDYENPVIYTLPASTSTPRVVYRQAGDRYILVEYGDNSMDINISYRIHRLIEEVQQSIKGIVEMSRGVRSVLIEFHASASRSTLMKALVDFEKRLQIVETWQVPSRIIRLPMCFEDSKTLEAVKRYRETIRSKAPWLPNNVDFIQRVNKFSDRSQVRDILYTARYLVLGLGDVFLGAPCTVPLDPRHRLLGTKYNPSRTYTANGTVGIGGMYMAIYTMDSPGGYQLVGRTIPIWDKLSLGQERPWLMSPFDQIEYYPVNEEELDNITTEVENGRYAVEIEQSVFDFGVYSAWLKDNSESIDAHMASQAEGLDEFTNLIKVANEDLSYGKAVTPKEETPLSASAVQVFSEVTGRFWKSLVAVGDTVDKGQAILVVEAMKTEMIINTPTAGKVVKLYNINGDMVDTGDCVAVIEPVV